MATRVVRPPSLLLRWQTSWPLCGLTDWQHQHGGQRPSEDGAPTTFIVTTPLNSTCNNGQQRTRLVGHLRSQREVTQLCCVNSLVQASATTHKHRCASICSLPTHPHTLTLHHPHCRPRRRPVLVLLPWPAWVAAWQHQGRPAARTCLGQPLQCLFGAATTKQHTCMIGWC